ncbi:MAG TPA: peptidylprolyl isomerase [Polyangia bacterium]|nr:peptidylprolyl isomerase [Polyangia bacterium]
MKIQSETFVSIDYTLKLDSGDVVDKSEAGAPLEFVFGSGQIIPGLERRLAGMEQGERAAVVVEAAAGYGEVNEELWNEIPRAEFPADVDIKAGMMFNAETPHGPIRFRVREAEGDVVVADFNHPLAGERLHFDVTVVGVRAATPEEIAGTDCCGQHTSCSHCGGH